MQIGNNKSLVWKPILQRHLHDGISKTAKVLGIVSTAATTSLIPVYPKAALPVGIIGFVALTLSQCIDIVVPVDNSQNNNTDTVTTDPKSI